jgi:NO-binding membrane sensor protein with MHYT domain
MFAEWFRTDEAVETAIGDSYDTSLVLLSYLVAVLVSYTALHLMARVATASNQAARTVRLVTGAVWLGG